MRSDLDLQRKWEKLSRDPWEKPFMLATIAVVVGVLIGIAVGISNRKADQQWRAQCLDLGGQVQHTRDGDALCVKP